MQKNIKLGFSTADFRNNIKTKEAIFLIKKIGCNAIELGFVYKEDFFSNQLEEIEKTDLEGFEYISFHAPKFNYENNEETKNIFKIISKFNKKIGCLDLVVFHPDNVKDFSIFDNLDFNIGFENMDCRKKSCKSVSDIEGTLSKNNKFKFVLDINHAYQNDQSLQIVKDFYKKFGKKIAEIHLSGFKGFHDPLFKTKQLEIINAIQNSSVPIIIESELTPENVSKEYNYILKNIH
jgi:hypothetical protein